MIKKEQYSYLEGLNTDTPPSKLGKDKYVMLKNGRITSSFNSGDNLGIATNGAVRCQSGNELLFTFTSINSISANAGSLMVQYKIDGVLQDPKVFTGVVNAEMVACSPVSQSNITNILAAVSEGPITYFLTTTADSLDCIWKYEGTTLELLYVNNLGWYSSVPKDLDIVINVESSLVTKIYIADGVHQVFSMNLSSTADLKKPKRVLYMVPQYTMSQPVLKHQISGGRHTSGAVQYAYNLFNINGGQTKISPASELIFLGKSNGGGDVNEIVGKSNVIEISEIDASYDYIRIYAIKYSVLDVTPTVSVIGEYGVPKDDMFYSGQLIITDDGSVKYDISIESLVFLGGTEIIPRCIIAKKNRLLLANIEEDIFDINQDMLVDNAHYFDSRAYSTNVGASNITLTDKNNVGVTLDKTARAYTITGGSLNLPIIHDAIQDKDNYYFHPASGLAGGEGRHLSYTILKKTPSQIEVAGYPEPDTLRHMKVGEVYRWAIEFYNDKSQKSTPQWIADVKVPVDYYGFIDGTRITIEFVISSEGIHRLAQQGIIGYKFLRVERAPADRTIVAQGIVTPMIFQETSDAAINYANNANGETYRVNNVKVSCPWVRHYQDQIDIAVGTFDGSVPSAADVKINALLTNGHISPKNPYSATATAPVPFTEIYRAPTGSPTATGGLHLSFQDNRMMQLFSPETIFGDPLLYTGMKVRAAVSLQQTYRTARGKLIYTDLNDIARDLRPTTPGTANMFNTSKFGTVTVEEGGNFIHANGYIGPNKPYPTEPGIKTEQLIQYYREYAAHTIISKVVATGLGNDFEILDSPEIGTHDSAVHIYNGNDDYKYSNSLQNILADGRVEFIRGTDNNNWNTPIYGVDAIASRNITFVQKYEVEYEHIMESAFTAAGGSITSHDNVLLMEIVVDVDNQYGGKYYEDRSINKYMSVGEYQPIVDANAHTYNVINCGDVFVNDFIFSRICRINGAQFSDSRIQMAETVKIPIETTINLKQRSDNSYGGWEARFLPTDEEFHKYNPIFSQEANALYSMPDPFLFVKNTSFSNRIMATKPKIAGEIIDSWTDVLVNEELYVEGEYGRINRMIKFNDNLYVFQRDGVSIVSVLPRVQVAASDAIAIELGVGQVLNTYQYINTNSGCDDFNGIISTSSAVYYGDKIRRTINIIEGATVSGLSDTLGVSMYVKGYDTNMTYKPNYSLGFNPLTDDVMFSMQKQSNSYNTGAVETLVYDEGIKRFTSILDMPALLMYTIDGKVHSTPNLSGKLNQVWNHFAVGNSCKFYGTQYSMELTVCLNPENAEQDVIFNTLEWTHDIVDTTTFSKTSTTGHNKGYTNATSENITSFAAWNDYLTAIPPTLPADIQRRWRMSRLFIPRANESTGDRSRMRGHYLFAKLSYLPSNTNYTILLNNLTLYYNAQR